MTVVWNGWAVMKKRVGSAVTMLAATVLWKWNDSAMPLQYVYTYGDSVMEMEWQCYAIAVRVHMVTVLWKWNDSAMPLWYVYTWWQCYGNGMIVLCYCGTCTHGDSVMEMEWQCYAIAVCVHMVTVLWKWNDSAMPLRYVYTWWQCYGNGMIVLCHCGTCTHGDSVMEMEWQCYAIAVRVHMVTVLWKWNDSAMSFQWQY